MMCVTIKYAILKVLFKILKHISTVSVIQNFNFFKPWEVKKNTLQKYLRESQFFKYVPYLNCSLNYNHYLRQNDWTDLHARDLICKLFIIEFKAVQASDFHLFNNETNASCKK